jgi:hypothetical protein
MSLENRSNKRNRLSRSEMRKKKESLVSIVIAPIRNARKVDLCMFTL